MSRITKSKQAVNEKSIWFWNMKIPNHIPQIGYYRRSGSFNSPGALYSGTFMSKAEPEYPKSSPVRTAHFSPMRRAVE